MLKTCTKCGIEKNLEDFRITKNGKYGRDSRCRVCMSKREHDRFWNNREKELARRRKHAHENIEQEHERSRRFREANPNRAHLLYLANKEKYNEQSRRWRAENLERAREIQRGVSKRRYEIPENRLSQCISSAIYRSLRENKKANHWEDIIGFTLEQLKHHIEKQFVEGMSWDNYGEWHIDHIIPLSAHHFKDASDIDFKKAWGLKNLQPLWSTDNQKKWAKLDKPFQPSLLIQVA